MPAKPTWFLRLPEILDQLRALSTPLLDRPAIESLFQIRRRRAHQLMAAFGGYQSGRTCLIPRRDLIRALERLQRGEAFSYEATRKRRLSEELDQTRRHLIARRVRIPAPVSDRDPVLANLPATTHLEPGALHVEFTTAEDLLRQLLGLAQAISHDYEGFEQRIIRA